MTFLRKNTHKNLHSTSFCTRSDDPAQQCPKFRSKSGWFGPGPDDPDLVTCERPEQSRPNDPALHRMIRTWEFQCVFCLFCSYPRWSEVIPDDPGTTRKHTTITFGGGTIYTPSPPPFISLSLPDQPQLKTTKSSTSLHPRAWFLQGNTKGLSGSEIRGVILEHSVS